MTAPDFVAFCRKIRHGVPEGDLRDPQVLASVLMMLLADFLAEIPGDPTDINSGSIAVRHLATLISHVEDFELKARPGRMRP